MFHYYFQLFLPLMMAALVLSTLTYHLLGLPTLGGYPAALTVAVFGAFLGGVLGMSLGPSAGETPRWLSLLLPACTVSLGILFLFHKACRLYDE